MDKNPKHLRKLAIAGLSILTLLAINFMPVAAITKGQLDSANRYSNVGALVISVPGEGDFQVCSGTLIAERAFLTAGHCTFFLSQMIAAGELSIENIKVSFDPLDSTVPASFWDAQKLVTHPDFQPVTAFAIADVGVVILAQSPGLTPVHLAPVGYLDLLQKEGQLQRVDAMARFTVVGYGANLVWPPPQLDWDPIGRYFTDAVYQSLSSRWIQLNQNPVVGNGGICFGDSGGPTFWKAPNGEQILVGVNSWVGAVNCNSNGYGYRVDLAEIRSFIDQVSSQ
jgi:Trypsin